MVESRVPSGRVVQADGIEPVAPQLHADGALGVPFEEVPEAAVGDAAAGGDAPLGLLELVAVDPDRPGSR